MWLYVQRCGHLHLMNGERCTVENRETNLRQVIALLSEYHSSTIPRHVNFNSAYEENYLEHALDSSCRGSDELDEVAEVDPPPLVRVSGSGVARGVALRVAEATNVVEDASDGAGDGEADGAHEGEGHELREHLERLLVTSLHAVEVPRWLTKPFGIKLRV